MALGKMQKYTVTKQKKVKKNHERKSDTFPTVNLIKILQEFCSQLHFLTIILMTLLVCWIRILNTVNFWFKKDLKLQIHLHNKAFFSDDRFLDSLHKSFLYQTTLDLRKEKWTFLNREFTVLLMKWRSIFQSSNLTYNAFP